MPETKLRRVNSSSHLLHLLAAVVATTCVLFAGPPSAAAEGARVLDAERKVESAAFAADAATGRAWVDVTLARRFASGKEARAAGTRVPVLVTELVYDASTHEIVHVDGDRRTVCATRAKDAVVPSGACVIDARIEARPIDTGFGREIREHVVVRVVRDR